MDNITITPTKSPHACCCVCLAQNYKTERARLGDSSVYVQDLYDLRLGRQILCLCPLVRGILKRQPKVGR